MNQSTPLDLSYVMESVRASGLLTSLCTITTPPASTTFNGAGSPDPTTVWPVLADHEDIPCIDAPVTASEQKTIENVQSVNMRHVLLDNYYPLILARYRATIGGVEYDILTAESDSQRQMTRLFLEKRTI